MPTFGQHETAQRLHLSGVGAIYALKADDKRVIKVLQPPQGIWSEEQLRFEIDGFLLRAKTQRLVAKTSKHWAPVHEVSAIRAGTEGSTEGGGGEAASRAEDTVGAYIASGAYAVLDRYERSAQSLLDGRVNLDNNDLRNIMSGVIRGLLDCRGVAKRPHGNLKPSNILLANSTNLAAATVHLVDLAPDGALNAGSDKKDLADLAKILYELVNLRPYQGGTIGRSREWDRLGPNGEDWRKLCSALLDPGAPAEERDLEKILASVDTWRAMPKKSKLPLIAAAVVVLLIAGGVTTYVLTRPVKRQWNEAAWHDLCLSYYAWYEDFDKQLANDRDKFQADPHYPQDILVQIDKARNKRLKKETYYTPQDISKVFQSTKEIVTMEPPEEAKSGYGPNYTQDSLDLISAVKEDLSPQKWPLINTFQATAKTFDDHGWKDAAAELESLIKSTQPPAIPPAGDINARLNQTSANGTMLDAIDSAVQAANSVSKINTEWAGIESDIKNIQQLQTASNAEVPLLQKLPEFAKAFPTAETQPGKPAGDPIVELDAKLAQVAPLLKELVADLTRKDMQIVFSELAKDPAVQLPADGRLTVILYKQLPTVLPQYAKLKVDPRNSAPWDQALADIDEGMIKPITEANPTDPNLAKLIQRRDALQKQITAWASYAPIEKNRTELETLVTKATDDLARLGEDGNAWSSPYKIDPADYLQKQHDLLNASPLAKATPAVAREWQKAHSALLAKISTSPQDLKKWQIFKVVDDKFKTLQKTYAGFDAAIPTDLPGLSSITTNDWRHTIAVHVATTYREAALADLMTNPNLKWSNDLPQVDDPGYASFKRERLAAFDALRKQTIALIADYSTIQERLDRLDLLPNQPVPNAPTWRDLFTQWKQSNSSLLADAVITDALKPITTRVNDLLAIDLVTDYPPLLKMTAQPAAEVVLTAWRKLGNVPVNESLPVLSDEDAAESRLLALANALAKSNAVTSARLNEINAEIKSERPRRWHRWVDTLASAAPIQTALDRRADFAVTLNPQTDSAMIFNDAFYQLRKKSESGLKEAELKPIAQSFINDIQRMPSGVSQDSAVKALLADIAKPLAQNAESSSTSDAGPKLAGWGADLDPAAGTAHFFFPAKGTPQYTLDFRKLPDQVDSKTVYLCTTELSLGIFAKAITAAPSHLPDLDKPHWLQASGTAYQAWPGPRAWKINGSEIVLDDDWLFRNPIVSTNPLYPATAPDAPSMAMPIQRISPWVALYAAHLLGCRLPTSAEWTEAYQKFELPSPTKDWNIRGAAWDAQKAFCFQMASKFPDANWPYPDAGIFQNRAMLDAPDPSVFSSNKAKPWAADTLAKDPATRLTPTAADAILKNSSIWFRRVDAKPATPSNPMHDLVGNVAEYVFDDPAATKALQPAAIHPTLDEIDAAVAAAPDKLAVIGGSSLSGPEIPLTTPQQIDLDSAYAGFSDVGIRLAYTAPFDSIEVVLARIFKDPKYLPVARSKT